jgi:hypothetical protein
MDSVAPLVNSEATTAVTPATAAKYNITDASAIHIVQLLIPATYLGHDERVSFLDKVWGSMSHWEKIRLPLRNFLRAFYVGVAAARSYRRKTNKQKMAVVESSLALLTKGKWTLQSLLW